jgi:hypothetical protein
MPRLVLALVVPWVMPDFVLLDYDAGKWTAVGKVITALRADPRVYIFDGIYDG